MIREWARWLESLGLRSGLSQGSSISTVTCGPRKILLKYVPETLSQEDKTVKNVKKKMIIYLNAKN